MSDYYRRVIVSSADSRARWRNEYMTLRMGFESHIVLFLMHLAFLAFSVLYPNNTKQYHTMPPIVDKINRAVQGSFVGRYFEMEQRQTTFFSELRGATATFLSMAYILAVNPRILADSGGPCVPNDSEGGIFGPEYLQCQSDIKKEYVTSTAIASLFGCMAMGILANLPVALAPGMGMVSLEHVHPLENVNV